MVKLIVGTRGTGKTKILVNMMNETAKKSEGAVVCIDKTNKLMHEANRNARLVDVERYGISGHEAFAGFIFGILAGNYDITDIYVDSLFKIVGRDYDKLEEFFCGFSSFTSDINIVFTVSEELEKLPKSVQKLAI